MSEKLVQMLDQNFDFYCLRYCVSPYDDCEFVAEQLAKYCREHKISSLHLHINTEEWNEGHLDLDENGKWFRMLDQLVPFLKSRGIKVSLNPWTTILHCERGRSPKEGHGFSTMVSPTGRKSKIIASWACQKWQSYIARIFAKYAAYHFDIIWIEDDFRFHNHEPLDWGGDFSEAMLENFNRARNSSLTREEVLAGLLAPGKPSQVRIDWINEWSKAAIHVAGILRDAVFEVAPDTRIGLMSSIPWMHAVEGRNWPLLWERLKTNRSPVHRPNFFPYQDTEPMYIARGSFMLSLQEGLRPSSVEAFPEIENVPFGRVSKSNTMTWASFMVAALHGSDGFLLDMHPFTSVHPADLPEVGEALDQSRSSVAKLAELLKGDAKATGWQVIWSPESVFDVRLDVETRDLSSLVVNPENPALFANLVGLPVTAASSEKRILAGPSAWSVSKNDLMSYLEDGQLILDGEAAHILYRRGFGEQLGILGIQMHPRSDLGFAFETWESEAGLNRGSVTDFRDYYRCDFGGGWRVLSKVASFENEVLGPGLSCLEGAGSRVVVYPFPLVGGFPSLGQIFPMHLRRRKLFHDAILGTKPVDEAYLIKGDRVLILSLEAEEKWVVCWNLSFDAQQIEFAIPVGLSVCEAWLFKPLCDPEPSRYSVDTEKLQSVFKADQAVPLCGFIMCKLVPAVDERGVE